MNGSKPGVTTDAFLVRLKKTVLYYKSYDYEVFYGKKRFYVSWQMHL